MYNDQSPAAPSHKPHPIRRIILLAGVGLIVLGVGLNVYSIINAPTCFTANDYAEFYGITPSDVTFAPGSDFFTGTYRFTPSTTSLYTAETDASPSEDAASLAAFYNKHPKKQVAFYVQTAYPSGSDDSKQIAEKRIETVKKSLTDAGIGAELINTKNEAYDVVDETIEYDNINMVTLSLKSADTCRE